MVEIVTTDELNNRYKWTLASNATIRNTCEAQEQTNKTIKYKISNNQFTVSYQTTMYLYSYRYDDHGKIDVIFVFECKWWILLLFRHMESIYFYQFIHANVLINNMIPNIETFHDELIWHINDKNNKMIEIVKIDQLNT
jgi:hypothetical protein